MRKVCIDGNTAAANIAYMFNEMAFIYPITPSSTMAELCDEYSSSGRPNIFGTPLRVHQMQSEAGVAGALHGALCSGAMATTFTSSQGLLLMLPNMYKIAGELLPCVIYVSARTVATHALNIFCDYSDIYACLKTGFNIINCASVQEVNDLAIACNLATYKNSTPFICFFDGFRTSHELNTIEQTELSDLAGVLDFDAIQSYKSRHMSPVTPYAKGTNQNTDVFFQNRVASLGHYQRTLADIKDAFATVTTLTGRHYDTVEYFGSPDAENVVVCMGTAVDSLKRVVGADGILQVRVLKPFDEQTFMAKLPRSVRRITVIERNLDTNGTDTLFGFIATAIAKHHIDADLYSGCYGLGGKEFTPDMARAVFDNMTTGQKAFFTVGIDDDLYGTSLPVHDTYSHDFEFSARVYGLGNDGSVSASKSTIKILGLVPEHYTQGYFEYDSKKSGSLTISHLRYDSQPIDCPYVDRSVDLVQCNHFNFLLKYDLIQNIKPNGILLINTHFDANDLDAQLPNFVKNAIKTKHLSVYTIDASRIAREHGLKNKINNVMQLAMFCVSGVVDYDFAYSHMVTYITKMFASKGDSVVQANITALDDVRGAIHSVDTTTFTETTDPRYPASADPYVGQIINPIAHLNGGELPTSAFAPDGHMPVGTTKYEKRGIADQLPQWLPEHCIQCGRCAIACPHSAIRPVLFHPDGDTPDTFISKKHHLSDYQYRLQISPMDCTGCGVCSEMCPAKTKALHMCPFEQICETERTNYDYSTTLRHDYHSNVVNTVSLQFRQPYFEFSGACAGCGETPYLRLLSQLYGDRLMIANATGCSSIYGGTYPTCPYTKDDDGLGVAWANSLFEDNAEFGYGIAMTKKALRADFITKLRDMSFDDTIQPVMERFLADTENHEQNRQIYLQLRAILDTKVLTDDERYLSQNLSYIISPTVWIVGGDGWAFDIGYGGLDHVLASGENINILVLDTEVYSNTGGQTSKSTPRGASAKFNVSGKANKKKDLLSLAMTYQNVYVAQVVLGANPDQAVRAFVEAEKYDGVSIIVAYSPCINHGYDMRLSQTHARDSVQCGYNTLFRYDPSLDEPLQIDSPAPTKNFEDFVLSENRFKITAKSHPELISLSQLDATMRSLSLHRKKDENHE